MHKEVLNKKQTALLPLLAKFKKDFGLVGGTAIAFYLGHRESVDFDLFSNKEFVNSKIRRKIVGSEKKIEHIFYDEKNEYSVLVNGVKLTFLFYPFKIKFSEKFSKDINLPDLLTLGAMKAYALGRRAKWKDYIDLYFIGEHYGNLNKTIAKAKKIFKNEFNEKIFRSQLAYFKDIDYSEKINFKKGFKISDQTVRKKLKEFSLK